MEQTKKNPLTSFIENKLVPVSTGFAQNAYVRCIGSGSQSLMAIIMIGAIFNLFNSIAWEPYQNLITSLGISSFLTVVYNASMNFMGIFMVFSIAYNGAKIWDHAELSFNNGLLALMSYLILIPYGADETGNSIIQLDYLGSHGVFLAFIVGILVTKINIFIVDKKITIKMPEGVPENVTQSFIALIPGAAVAIVCGILRGIFLLTPWGNILDAVYAILQTPLANVTGSLPGFLILITLAQILWFFGVHGSYTVLGILYPIWFTYLADNMAAAAAGETIPHMWNVSMYDLATNGGCGCTLGLVIIMFFFAKSERYKTFSKIVFPCGIFNINEPLVYGLPLMMNFTFVIPFILTPLLTLLLAYGAIALGLMPIPTGILGMNTMPIVIYGIVQGSWKIGVFQIFSTLLSCAIWYPFFKSADAQALKEEKEAAGLEAAK
jgi:PTS system cellobiose-specific IIC component